MCRSRSQEAGVIRVRLSHPHGPGMHRHFLLSSALLCRHKKQSAQNELQLNICISHLGCTFREGGRYFTLLLHAAFLGDEDSTDELIILVQHPRF